MNKNNIPKGAYCYELLDINIDKDGVSRHIKTCPYFRWLSPDSEGNIDAYCKLLKEKDLIMLNDRCKICGINKESE